MAGLVVFSGERGSGVSGALSEVVLGGAEKDRLNGDGPTHVERLAVGGFWTERIATAGTRQ